jgi:probable F420-dependent oxidoreductase
MTDHRYGITIPLSGASLMDQRAWIEQLPDLGYTDVWSSEVDGFDAFTPLLLASQWAPSLRLGPAIVPIYTRGPALLAQSAAAMGVAAPGRFVMGLGTSSNVIVERWNGMPFEKPYQRMLDTVRFVRLAMTGEKVTQDYESFSIKGFRLSAVPTQPVPLLVAALREGMLRLAGREADGAIVNWLSPDDVTQVVPHVHAGGEGKEIVARIFVLATDDADTARGMARSMIAAYLNVPVYAAFHEWLGRGERLTPMWDAWKAGDRKGALAAIPDSVVDELVVWGPPEKIRETVQRYIDNGVTCPAPMVVPFGDPLQAVKDLARQ